MSDRCSMRQCLANDDIVLGVSDNAFNNLDCHNSVGQKIILHSKLIKKSIVKKYD